MISTLADVRCPRMAFLGFFRMTVNVSWFSSRPSSTRKMLHVFTVTPGQKTGSLRINREGPEPTRTFRLRLTWVKLDQPSAAVTEVSAHFGGSVLHLHKRQRLSFRPVPGGSQGEEPILPGWPRMPDRHSSRCAQSGSEVLPLTHRFYNRWQRAGPGTRTGPVCGADHRRGITTQTIPATLKQTHLSGDAEFPAGSVRRNQKLSFVSATSGEMT